VKINISNKYTYVPKWNGNRKLPPAEQVSVSYRFMTCEEEEKYSQFIPKYKGDKRDEVELEIKTNANEIWDICVQRVDGLKDENGKDLTDPKAVRKIAGTYGLITELVGIIRKGIGEEDQKN
jgi:hypothetical protein